MDGTGLRLMDGTGLRLMDGTGLRHNQLDPSGKSGDSGQEVKRVREFAVEICRLQVRLPAILYYEKNIQSESAFGRFSDFYIAGCGVVLRFLRQPG